MTAKDRVLFEAKFNPKVCAYWLVSTAFVLTILIVTIPLLIIWLPIGMMVTKKYLSKMECVLTNRNLIVKKGMFVRQEKTIPLEKITDLGLVQGPIMRRYGIHNLSIETAGQSTAGGALATLTGIIDVEDFREQVLAQRDRISEGGEKAAAGASCRGDE